MTDKNFIELIDSIDELIGETTFWSDTHKNDVDEDVLICECFCVSEKMIIDYMNCPIKNLYLSNTEDLIRNLQNEYGLGNGCGKCLQDFTLTQRFKNKSS